MWQYVLVVAVSIAVAAAVAAVDGAAMTVASELVETPVAVDIQHLLAERIFSNSLERALDLQWLCLLCHY